MSKKRDSRQIEAIARDFVIDSDERREFGDHVEKCGRSGEMGSGENGDFTSAELREKVAEFRSVN